MKPSNFIKFITGIIIAFLTASQFATLAANPSQLAGAIQADVTAMTNTRNQLLDAWDVEIQASRSHEGGRQFSLVLENALLEMPLEITLKRFGGQWINGEATCRTYNKSENLVEAGKLEVSADALVGTLNVTLVSDGWVPQRGTTYDLLFDIDATIKNGAVSGQFKASGTEGLDRKARIGAPGSIYFRLVRQNAYEGMLTGSATKFDMSITRPQESTPVTVEGDLAALYAAAVALEQQAEHVYQQIRAVDIAKMGGLSFQEALATLPVYPPVRPAFAEASALATLDSIAKRMARMRALVDRRLKIGDKKADVVIGLTRPDDPDFEPYMVSGPMPSAEGKPNILAKVDTGKEQLWAFPGKWHMLGIFKPHERRDLLAPWLPEMIEALDATYNIELPADTGGSMDRSAAPTAKPGWFAYNTSFDPIKPWWGDQSQKIRRPGRPNTYVYCVTDIYSEVDQDVWVGLDADDYAKLWVNDTLIWASPRQRASLGDWSIFPVSLKQGANHVLVRFENTYGNHQLYLRFCTQGKPLQVAERAAERKRLEEAYAKLEQPFVRGVNFDGMPLFPDADPVMAWDIEKGINILWRKPFERFSHATPVIVGDKLFTQMEPHTLICLDKVTGKELWRRDSNILELIADPKIREEALAAYAKDAGIDRRIVRNTIAGLSEDLMKVVESLENKPNPTLEKRREELEAALEKTRGEFGSVAKYIGHVPGAKHFEIEPAGFDTFVGYTMPVPVTDGKYIWVKYGTGVAACYELDGNRKWMTQHHLYGSGPPNVASPILAGNVLVVHGSGGGYWAQHHNVRLPPYSGHWMVGMNATTGEILWDFGPLRSGGYGGATGPALVRVTNGHESMYLAVHGEGQVIRADDGVMLLDHIGARQGGHTPMVFGHTVCLGTSAVELFMHSRDIIGYRVHENAGGIHYKGKRYRMECDPQGYLCTMDVADTATGRDIPLLQSRTTEMGNGYPLPAAAGNYVFLPARNKVNVVRTVPRPVLAGASKIEPFNGGIVFDQNRMYVRTMESLLCIGRTGEAGAQYEKTVLAQTLIAQIPQELTRVPMEVIKPDATYKPGKDVPVVPLRSGATPDRWLFAGPLPVDREKDLLASIGGCSKARPENGTNVEFGGATATFQPLDPKFVADPFIDLDGPVNKNRKSTSFYYTVLKCPNDGVYKLACDKPGISFFVNGVNVRNGDHVEIQPGLYPLLVMVDAGDKFPPMIPFKWRVMLEAANDPNMVYRQQVALIRENADLLKEILEIVPNSVEAARAAALLKAIE